MSTEKHGNDGEANVSVVQQRTPLSTKGLDIHGNVNESIEQQILTSTKDLDTHGNIDASISQQTPISTEDYGNQGEAYISIFGNGPLYPHCVETWEAANAKAQPISRPDVTPMTNVPKFW